MSTDAQENTQSGNEVDKYKVILIGDTAVGKTNIIINFVESRFEEECVLTIGPDPVHTHTSSVLLFVC